MKKGSDIKHVIAGLFFVIGLILIGLSVFFIGLERGLTEPKFQVIVLFDEVGGLVEGAPIRISGINVGMVGEVDFLDQPIEGRSLKVTMNIFKRFEFQFRKCSRVSVKTEGVLGQKLVEISEDHSRKVFDMTKPIVGEDPLDVEDMAGVITRTAVALERTSDKVSDLTDDFKNVTHKGSRFLNRLEEKLLEGNLFKIF